jgi:hypothetical protein
MTFNEVYLLMLFGHALADYPLQGDYIARTKGIDSDEGIFALVWHCVIHAGFVGIITGSLWLAAAEFIAHALIDTAKINGHTSFRTDQFLHIACKVVWTVIYVIAIQP